MLCTPSHWHPECSPHSSARSMPRVGNPPQLTMLCLLRPLKTLAYHCQWALLIHFLQLMQWYCALQGQVCAVLSHLVMSDSLWPHGCSPPGFSVHEDSPGKNPGVSCHALLQEIFPIQISDPGLLHCRWILYCLSYQGSPRMLEWVAYPFSRRSSQPRNKIGVSCITGRCFTVVV